MKPANYFKVVSDDDMMILIDLGPFDKYATITNTVEDIIKELKPDNKRFLYYDSNKILTEVVMLHDNPIFYEYSGLIVELEPQCWIASYVGDPGRTTNINNAKIFSSYQEAKFALNDARIYRQFKNAKIIPYKMM